MTKIRRTHSKELKFRAAVAMLKGEKTLSQLSSEYSVAQSVLHRWKKMLNEGGPTLFEDQRRTSDTKDNSSELERKIGQLVMENDFLKKALGQ